MARVHAHAIHVTFGDKYGKEDSGPLLDVPLDPKLGSSLATRHFQKFYATFWREQVVEKGGNKILKISGGNRQILKNLPARSHFVTTFGESQGF